MNNENNIDENFEIIGRADDLLGKRFGKLVVDRPYKFHKIGSALHSGSYHIHCKCDCGSEVYLFKHAVSKGKISDCGCSKLTNIYEVMNEYVSVLYASNDPYKEYPILIPTSCVEYMKQQRFQWVLDFCYSTDNRIDIVAWDRFKRSNNRVYIHRIIVDYINSQLGLPKLSDDISIDHISGNTLNNLYYPGNDFISLFYNNLRNCNSRQNQLNKPCIGYRYKPHNSKLKPYEASIVNLYGNKVYKLFSTPEECIEWNISQLSDEDKPFYYHSKSNPRNWNWTYNALLNSIGYNNITWFVDSDFSEEYCDEEDEDLE